MSFWTMVMGGTVLAIWGLAFCVSMYIVFFMDDRNKPKGA